MCGIAGIYHFASGKKIDRLVLKKMTDIIRYRGPDGEGYYVNANVGLGHRRLSIIDLKTGDQPMFNESGSIALVYNGEIYDYIELREELVSLGHVFRTESDSEVIVKAYEQWGVECQNRFNGMWAFALWDNDKQQLFLSRDRIGEKPLHYCVYDNTLFFGSEMKSVFAAGVPKRLRTELIETYLVMTHIPGPDSFYEGVYKLKPGHFIIAGSDGIKENKYWDLPELDEANMLSDKKRIYEEFAYLLEDSVRIRMRSDVPYGAFLSGGLDSSSIVSLMAGLSPHPVETFTIGFPEKAFDESTLAREVAEKFKANHHKGTVHPSSLQEALRRSAFHFDEPFGDSSAIPTWQVSNFAVKHVKMVLTGDGGDEILSGYNAYTGIKIAALIGILPELLQKMAPAILKVLAHPASGDIRYTLNRAISIFETAKLPFAERSIKKRCYTPLAVIKKLTQGIKHKIDIEDTYAELTKKIPYQNDFYKLMYINFKHSLPDDYLVKVDRMSMANSLETRTPFLDYRLIEFMTKVDKDVKHQGWERKSVLRRSIGKSLPENLQNASKRGFGVPLREWFKDNMNVRNIPLKNVSAICTQRTIQDLVAENATGKRDNGNFIWCLMMLDKALA